MSNGSLGSNGGSGDQVKETALSILPDYAGTLVILSVGIFTIFVAVAFNSIRKFTHKNEDSLDLAFDAGGKVSVGLTATTIVSQWTWAATLLQSSAVGSKYGISGPFWYAAGATVQILLFAGLSLKLKIRAPGAKTFLQVIRRRFGVRTHKVYCGYALLTNIIVTAMLMLGGAEVITSLVDNYSVEMATIMCAAIICGYTMVGGLGATFYASYFNTTFIFIGMFIFCFNVYFSAGNDSIGLGSIEKVYKLLDRWTGPVDNRDRSYLTMISKQGLMFGIINIIGNFGTVFVDQAYWQSSVAAKPKDGVFGFVAGGLVWFSVPFTFATTMGLAYLALSANEGAPLLTDDQVNAGLVPVAVASKIGGYSTLLILLIMILMAVTSTGSAEVVAVASILIYDIYMGYLKVTLGWVYLSMGVLIGSAVIPVGLTLFWDRLTSNGMTFGPICGTAMGVTAWLFVASRYEGGLARFFTNTGQEWSMLVGNVVSLGFGGLTSVIVSFVENRHMNVIDRDEIWAATLDIDNPLYPWTELYKKELNLKQTSRQNNRPPLSEIEKSFKTPEKVAITGSVLLTLVFVVIWPAVTCLFGVFSSANFYIWVMLSALWGLAAGLFIIVVPVWSEIKSTLEAYRDQESIVSPQVDNP